MTKRLKEKVVEALRWSERYTKTDMVYLVQAGIWNNLSVITSSALALMLSVAFANLLPKEVYGTYQYLLSLSALIASVCLGGMMQAVGQSVARGNDGDLRVALRVQLMWGILPGTLGLLGALYYAVNDNYLIAGGLAAISILTPLINSFSIYGALLGGKRQFKRAFIYGTITNIAYYSSISVAMVFFKNALVLVFVNLFINAVVAIYLYFRTIKVNSLNETTDPGTVRYGVHLSIMNAFTTFIGQLDALLVFHFLGPVQLAVYTFATFVPERIGGMFSFIATAAFPKFSQRTRGELRRSIVPQTMRAGLFGAAGAVFYIALAPILFRLLFPKYADAILYTQLYAPVIIFMAANLVTQALISQRLKRELYITSFINPVLLIALQIPLLLAYGIFGMLAARLITDFVGLLLGIFLLLRDDKQHEGPLPLKQV